MLDFHCHLHDKAFDQDRREVIDRAKAAGVNRFLTVGTSFLDSQKAVELAHKDKSIWAAVGLHPLGNRQQFNAADFLALARDERVLAIGEIGFDFHESETEAEIKGQKELFLNLIDIAQSVNKPVILHLRSGETINAYKFVVDTLEKTNIQFFSHCFNGDLSTAKLFFERGIRLSFSGILTYLKSNEDQLFEVAKEASQKAGLLLETDAPYLAPGIYRGRRNEPAFIVETYKKIAQVLGVELKEVERLTEAAFNRYFPDI